MTKLYWDSSRMAKALSITPDDLNMALSMQDIKADVEIESASGARIKGYAWDALLKIAEYARDRSTDA